MRTALIIDDNPTIRDMLRCKIERPGWSVVEAADAHDGLQAFRSIRPQLVTLDLIMPINNGIGAVELAKVIADESPSTVLVVISSFASENEVSAFFRKLKIPVLSKASVQNPRLDKLLAYLDSVLEADNSPRTGVPEDSRNGNHE
jgi:two-component system chemotaxis response regulator CheY